MLLATVLGEVMFVFLEVEDNTQRKILFEYLINLILIRTQSGLKNKIMNSGYFCVIRNKINKKQCYFIL